MSSPIPPPVSFSIDAGESARLRKILFTTGGGRSTLLSSALLLLFGAFNAAIAARSLGWQNPLVYLPVSLYVVSFASIVWRTFERCKVRPEPATTVSFDDTGMSIVRGAATRSTQIPFARIRSVRLMPQALAVYGILTTYVTIPESALPDGGLQLLRFFSDGIVSKGMPEHTSHGETIIINSVSAVLARGSRASPR